MNMARVLFPAFLDLVGRRVLVVGGGSVAASKISRLLEAGAHVVVVAPDVVTDVEQLPVEIHRRAFAPADLDDSWYVVSAAPPAVNADVVREAAARGIFVNAVDDPRHATAFAGSGFQRGPVTVAISTGGEAPALARVLREAMERLIGRDVEDWTALAMRLRQDWRRERRPMNERRDSLLEALANLHQESKSKSYQTGWSARASSETGFVSLIGAGPGDPELLTRRAARRLAEADLVLYDALVSPATVSLATRAQQVFVGRRRGSATMGQEAIIRTLIRAARRGKRVVRLKGGDPFVFGRGGEEAQALKAAGVPFEIVPGVSSAFAAPAAASIPVTHRGVSGAVLVATGHDPDRFASLVAGIPPGSATVVVLMATMERGEVASALVEAGWPASTPAAIVWNASLPDQSVWSGTLDGLASAPDVDGPGTLVIGDVVAIGDALSIASPAGLESRLPYATVPEVCHG
jgi:uroporphyrin-III C-methyltransferase/precorrin-2 dehydrogenase/sirohydrochlorin ferrochelatase